MPVGALSLAPSVLQAATAYKQKRMAKNLKKSDYIPPALLESESLARNAANATQLPGQGRAEDNLDKATANTVSQARRTSNDSASVMEQVQAADAKTKQVVGDFGMKLADFKLDNQRNLQGVLSQKAQAEQANQDAYNAAKSALKGGSSVNAFNAVSNAASAGLMLGDGVNPATGKPFTKTADQIPKTDVTPTISTQQHQQISDFMKPDVTDPEESLMDTVFGRKKKSGFMVPNY